MTDEIHVKTKFDSHVVSINAVLANALLGQKFHLSTTLTHSCKHSKRKKSREKKSHMSIHNRRLFYPCLMNKPIRFSNLMYKIESHRIIHFEYDFLDSTMNCIDQW